LHEGESSSLDYKRDQYAFAGATAELFLEDLVFGA
jgi:hypothetical protein